MPRPTLFRLLLQERHWDNWVVFCTHFEETARTLAEEVNCPRLASVTVGRRTFDRWVAGNWYGRPQKDAARVLERLLGFPCTQLFAPAPGILNARKTVHDKGGLQASIAIGQRWPTSRLFLSAADDVADSWELMGRNVLDGTTAAVHFLQKGRHVPLVSTDQSRSVLVVTLGGTIAMTRSSGETSGVTPRLTGADLVAAVPGLDEGTSLTVEDFRQVPGASLTIDDIAELAAHLPKAAAADTDGIVITQGTDTLEETAFLLDLLYDGDAPVVLTGAMRNPAMPGADGPANLLAAVRTATSPAARGLGTLVVFANEIHAARHVRKTHATSTAAFASPRAGHVPASWVEPLQDLAARIPVVLASRTGAGSVLSGTYAFPGSESDLLARGLISAGPLDPYKARLLLLAQLGMGADRAAIEAAFTERR